jgi:nitroreductase
MSNNRRTFLKAAGGAGLVLVAGGALFAATRRPSAALRAWDAAKASSADLRLDVFRHAILAPNPHNRQPWQIQLIGRDEAVITCDLDRRLPQTDPFDRQITIGFGCFLELARMAAAERGLRVDTALFPEGEPTPRLTGAPIAHLRFVPDPGVAKDPLFGAILIRRSSKVPFDLLRAVEARTLDALTSAGGAGTATFASSDPAFVADLRALTWRSWMIEATTQRTWQESVDLMRIGRSEIEANPDGIALGGAVLEALALAGQISRKALANPASSAFRSGVDRYRAILEQTPSYLWVTTPGNGRFDQIAAGRAYVRVNLAAAASGLAMHPVSQALQEFPEMAAEHDALHTRLGVIAPQRVQMLARVGYAAAVDASARWPLEARLGPS